MSGRKKKHRAETPPASGHTEGEHAPPAAGKKRGAGRGKPAAPSLRWPLLAVLASLGGLTLGMVMVLLSLTSVATSDDPRQLVPLSPQASGANPGTAPSQATGPAATAPSSVAPPSQAGGQGVDPQRLELRTKGDPQAPVVVTEWFDFL